MTDQVDPPTSALRTEFPTQRSRLFWGVAIVAILAMLLVCVLLIVIAAGKS